MSRYSPVHRALGLHRTPTSIDVRQAALTPALQVTSSPTLTGRMKVIRSIAAVTSAPAAVADGSDSGGLVAELHHHPAVDEAGRVRVADPHPLDQDGPRRRGCFRLDGGVHRSWAGRAVIALSHARVHSPSLARPDRRVAAVCPRLVEWREERGRPAAPLPGRGLLGAAGPRLRRSRRPGSWSSASPRPPTAPTAPGACSPATAPATGSTPRCTGRASPTSPTPSTRGDGLRLRGAYVTAVVRCAPPANRPTPAERDNCLPYLDRASCELLDRCRVIVALGCVRLGRRAARAARARRRGCRGRSPASATAPRPRRAADACSAATTPASRTPSPAG